MARYSVAQAKNNLSSLMAAAERGEEVVITRYNRPAAKLTAVETVQPPKASQSEWMARIRRLTENIPMSEIDSGTLVRNMRDEVNGF